MALSIASYQSKTLINVSQDAHTSPSVDKSPVAGADDERVEDSLNEHRGTNAGGPVKSPRQPAEDSEEDDLYGLSPQGKASIAAANLVKKDRANSSAPPPGSTVNGHWSQQPAVETALQELQEGATGGALHEVLVNGATTLDSRSGTSTKRGESDEVHAESLKKPLVGAHHPEKHPSAAPLYANSDTALHRTPMAPPPAGTSALSALRAKKEALAVARAGGETVQASRSRTPAVGRAQDRSPKRLPFKERSRNVPTPAKPKPGAATAAQQATDDKPKSRKLGMSAQTPVGGREKSVQGTQKRKGAQAGARDDWDDDGAFEPSNKGKVVQRSAPSTLKRPTLSAKSRRSASIRKPTYDMPESPPLHTETTARSKRAGAARKPAMPAMGKAGISKANNQKDAAQDERVETARKGRPRKLVKLPDSDKYGEPEVRKQPARQAKLLNGAARMGIGEVEEADERDMENPRPASATIGDAKHASSKNGGRAVDETIEDFEHAFVLYDDDNKPATGDRDTQHGSAHSTARHTVQNPQVKMHTDLTNEQRDSYGIPKRSKYDTEKIGGSQSNAITLSDHPIPSSSVPSTPAVARPAAATLAQVRPSGTEGRRAPQTPAVFHSSPPLNDAQGTHEPPTGLLEPAESCRTTIISFDRSGPRNQGTRSAKKSVIGSARIDRTGVRRSKGRSSPAATSTKSYRTDRTALPNNVAEDVGDALAGFLKNPANLSSKPVAPDDTQAASLRAQRPAPRPILPLRQPTDVTEDSVEDAVDEREPQMEASVPANGAMPLKKPSVDRTASQLAMPPPAPKAGSTVESGQATASSAARRTTAVGKAASVDKEGGQAATQYSVKRAHEEDSFSHPAPKKSKRTTLDKQRTHPVAGQPAAIPQAKVMLPEHVPIREPEPSKRAGRKISRHASQGVDINGSPIPKNMIVPENATTLETYTQHAGLSPDQRLPASDMAARRTITDSPTNPTFFEEMLAVPSHQVKILASNEKRRPASPREDSQAITGVVLGMVNAKQLVMRDEGVAPPTDPFLSSESLRKVPKGPSSSSLFSEELRTRAEQIATKRRHAALADEDEDPDKTLVEPAPASKRLNGNPTSKRLRAAFADEDDPDQTLVEPEPRPERPKGHATHSRKGVGTISVADEENSADMPAIGLWRDALRPHQLNLFDELVAVSHRLVRHLVDHETAMHEAVYDYQRRGLNMIEQAELVRAQDYEKSLKQLAHEKEAVRQGLQQQSERMRGAMERVLLMKAERGKTDVLLLAEQARLEEMLAQLGGA
ncbi:hypothetical protein LTR02_013230 [Friedmanniomyces endolithicus]|nr:hypothetical protein LTR94_006962 [Friedmanniomyces endolithicus]KAK0788058.1 hypothetical protein LTR59_010130 [Friedmanniomyces endolithicus]KAK0808796.1 hypothetical protein LTR38_004502 [Friedmanniomyces endolithicus]KAK0892762.1 hypothetical protein LTR02_013230 [Friedmanniomyces endolithicus]